MKTIESKNAQVSSDEIELAAAAASPIVPLENGSA
jgi:hypothetical protein